MLPPLTLTMSVLKSSIFITAGLGGEGFIGFDQLDLRQIHLSDFQGFFRGKGRTNAHDRGSTLGRSTGDNRCHRLEFQLFSFFKLIRTTAEAPSLIPEELPAVTVPPSLNAGRNFAKVSTVVPWRGTRLYQNNFFFAFFIDRNNFFFKAINPLSRFRPC